MSGCQIRRRWVALSAGAVVLAVLPAGLASARSKIPDALDPAKLVRDTNMNVFAWAEAHYEGSSP